MDVGEKDTLVARDTRIGTYGAAVVFYSLDTALIWLVLYGQHTVLNHYITPSLRVTQ